MGYRNPTILEIIRKMTTVLRLPKQFAIVVYVLVSPALVLVDEVVIAYETRKQIISIDQKTQKNNGLGPKTIEIEIAKKITKVNTQMYTTNVIEVWAEMKPFHELLETEQIEFQNYYEDVLMRNEWLLQVMARESSIQLTLQNALVLYEFVYPPVYELNFNSFRYPSARWIMGIGLQLLSIVLSAYSTFNPILVNMKYKSDVERKPVGLLHYVITVLQIICHIAISVGIVFLVIGHKHKIAILCIYLRIHCQIQIITNGDSPC